MRKKVLKKLLKLKTKNHKQRLPAVVYEKISTSKSLAPVKMFYYTGVITLIFLKNYSFSKIIYIRSKNYVIKKFSCKKPLIKKRLKTPAEKKAERLEREKTRLKKRAVRLANAFYPGIFGLCAFCAVLAIEIIGFEKILSSAEILTYSIIGGLSIVPTIQFIHWLICKIRVGAYNRSIDPTNYCILRCGEPGSGKSSSAVYTAIILAQKMWGELSYKYWLNIAHEKEILKSHNNKKIEDWERVKKSYLYWKSHPEALPCLMSNIPLKIDGKTCVIATRAHLEQELPVPEFAVLFYDEVGSLVRVDEGKKNKPLEIADFYRWCRQFAEARLISTEQDKRNVYIDARRVTTENRYLRKQKAVLKPLLLTLAYKLVKEGILKRMSLKEAEEKSLRFYFFDCFFQALGFRKYQFKTFGSTESGSSEVEEKGSFILPSLLNGEYDSRYFRSAYRARDLPLELNNIWANE